MTTSRQRSLVALARMAWPDRSVEVVAPDHGAVHVWDEHGHVLLHVEHEFADAVLSVLAGDMKSFAVSVCLDIADLAVRERASRDGIDVIGWRDGQIVLWNESGKMGTGSTLRHAIENLDERQHREGQLPKLALRDSPALAAINDAGKDEER